MRGGGGAVTRKADCLNLHTDGAHQIGNVLGACGAHGGALAAALAALAEPDAPPMPAPPPAPPAPPAPDAGLQRAARAQAEVAAGIAWQLLRAAPDVHAAAAAIAFCLHSARLLCGFQPALAAPAPAPLPPAPPAPLAPRGTPALRAVLPPPCGWMVIVPNRAEFARRGILHQARSWLGSCTTAAQHSHAL